MRGPNLPFEVTNRCFVCFNVLASKRANIFIANVHHVFHITSLNALACWEQIQVFSVPRGFRFSGSHAGSLQCFMASGLHKKRILRNHAFWSLSNCEMWMIGGSFAAVTPTRILWKTTYRIIWCMMKYLICRSSQCFGWIPRNPLESLLLVWLSH